MTAQTVGVCIDAMKINLPVDQVLALLGIKPALAPRTTPPRIGDVWPGRGGVYAGIMRSQDGPDYHLIVSPAAEGEFEDLKWGSGGDEIAGAADDWNGMTNSIVVSRAAGTHPAVDKALAVQIDGHADFYLPSRRESALLYANVPEQFQKKWYWTSTQYGRNGAWYQSFDNGGQLNNAKGIELRARAVRRLPI